MAVILGLLIFCLGLYFLSLFFQVARLEKTMIEDVSLLEKYMIVTYALDKTANQDDGEGKEGEAGGANPSNPAKPA
jgi:hypothetical protein